MSSNKIPTQITKEMLEEYISDYDRINTPERMYEFALSYMLEDLAEQAEAKQNANRDDNALPEMSEDEDDDVSCEEDMIEMDAKKQEIEYDVKLMRELM